MAHHVLTMVSTWAHLPPYGLLISASHTTSLAPISRYIIHPQAGFMRFPYFPFLLFPHFLWPRPVTSEVMLLAATAQQEQKHPQ
jgi:hypothetical protein